MRSIGFKLVVNVFFQKLTRSKYFLVRSKNIFGRSKCFVGGYATGLCGLVNVNLHPYFVVLLWL